MSVLSQKKDLGDTEPLLGGVTRGIGEGPDSRPKKFAAAREKNSLAKSQVLQNKVV